jgi:succinate dehydrogenase / fumarate reductase cytochrome b subunit
MASAPQSGKSERPLSPHLQIWRWHPTMAASILHRLTGVGLYLAFLCLAAWLVLLAMGPPSYAWLDDLFHSWFGQLKLYGVFGVLAFHAANGVRHLVWDTGRHFAPKAASASAMLVVLFALAAPAALWFILTQGGRP